MLAATAVWLPAQQTIWFTPLPSSAHPVGFFGSTDYMSLFTPTAPWQKAASTVKVFKVYPDGVDAFSDADFTKLMADLKRRNIALALETAVLSSSTCGQGIEGFGNGFLPLVQRIKALGGNLDYIAMQQPFQWGALYKGPNSCQWTVQQVATNAYAQISDAKKIFPNLLVGDIMAVPPFREGAPDWAAQYAVWFDTWAKLAGAKLAFFHVDADWTVPNWQAAVAAIRPVATSHGIPFGMVYNGFLTDETDAAWMAAAERHMVEYEVLGGNAPPEEVNFQSWNPHPTHVMPETDPTAFTYLINRYNRTRTQIVLNETGSKLSGTLTAAGTPVAGATIQITGKRTDGAGTLATYTVTGPVPVAARTALVGARINSECYSCNGRTDLTVYAFEYSENTPRPATTLDFSNGLAGGWLYGPGAPAFDAGPAPYVRGLHITAKSGQAKGLNSRSFAVTQSAQFTLKITARVSPASAGSGYFTLIWFNAAGNEPSREIVMFEPETRTLGTVTTGADGSFSMNNPVVPGLYRITASYAGNDTLWPAQAGPAPPKIAAVVNAANFASGPIAPGEIVTIGGTDMGPPAGASLELDEDGKVSTGISGVQVLFNDVPAPLTYVSDVQINAVVPYELDGIANPFVQVKFLGQTSDAYLLTPAPTAPAMFTLDGSGSGPGAFLNQDNSYNLSTNPAPKGSYIVLFLTGEGQTGPAGITGQVTTVAATLPVTPQPLLPVTVLINGQPATIGFFGEAPGLVAGVMQMNVQVPPTAPSGNVPITVSIGGTSTPPGVTVAVQ